MLRWGIHWLLFSLLRQSTWQKQLKGGRTSCGSQPIMAEKAWQQEGEVAGHTASSVSKQGETLVLSLILLLIQFRDSDHELVSATFRVCSTTSVIPVEIPSYRYALSVSPRGFWVQ